jgi:hypothetical protein
MPDNGTVFVFLDPITPHFEEDRLFESHPYGEYHAPFVAVRDAFAAHGIPVHTADYLLRDELSGDHNLYFALGTIRNYKRLVGLDGVRLSALFHMEAPIVHPTTYRETPEASRYFKRVYSFSNADALAPFGCADVHLLKFQIPEPYDGIDGRFEPLWQRKERRFLCMISQNKLPTLTYNELYTERLRLLDHFSRNGGIDLYGIGWDRLPFHVGEPKPRPLRALDRLSRYVVERLPFTRKHPYEEVIRSVYRGPVESKYETMSKYTFAICYENMVLDGWINEKIFDAFLSGTIPIYRGAPDVTNYIPEDCFIDPRKFANYDELAEYLRSLTPKEITRYRTNARNFMSSEGYRPFTKDAFSQLFVNAVEEDLGVAL